MIFIDRDQTAIEHPVQGAGQSQTVTHRVAATALHGADMRRLHLRSAPAIAQHQTRHRASVAISLPHLPAESYLAVGSPGEALEHRAQEGLRSLTKLSRLGIVARGFDPLQLLRQPEIDDASEVRLGQSSHGKLHRAPFLGRPVWFGQGRLHGTSLHEPRDFPVEGEEGPGLDHREEPTLRARLRDHPLDFRHRKISAQPCLDRLIIDDPVAHRFLDGLQV